MRKQDQIATEEILAVPKQDFLAYMNSEFIAGQCGQPIDSAKPKLMTLAESIELMNRQRRSFRH